MTEQELDHAVEIFALSRASFDQIDRVAGFAGFTLGVTEQRQPTFEVVGVRLALMERRANLLASVAQGGQPANHRFLSDIIIAATGDVDDFDVVIRHQFVDGDGPNARADQIVIAARRFEHTEHAIEQRG